MTMNPFQLHWPSGIDVDHFLAHYWQKKPLLFRQAFPHFDNPMAPEELAGLACEEEIPSRIIWEHAKATPWEPENGPFDEETLASLPMAGYSLLVTDIEKHLPDFNHYLAPFRFIPDWRRDDLMISYAPPGGSVGPHIDDYDVFLIQAMGQRRWQIAQQPIDVWEFNEASQLKILSNFIPQDDWVLEPGDMLYLPPNVAHHGTAVDHCMTWSVGFRSPRHLDIVTAFVDDIANDIDTDLRYRDPDLAPPKNPGELDTAAREKLRGVLHQALQQPELFMDRWLGKYLSESAIAPQSIEQETISLDQLCQYLADGGTLERAADVRFLYLSDGEHHYLYTGGEELACPPSLAQCLCEHLQLDATHLAPWLDESSDILLALCNRQHLVLID